MKRARFGLLLTVFLMELGACADDEVQGTDTDATLADTVVDTIVDAATDSADATPEADAQPCIPEGQTGAIYPDAPQCCDGLTSIGCDTPEGEQCTPCVGGFICAKCGDGTCGPGENQCNCTGDCP
jgi:hypothetical protein